MKYDNYKIIVDPEYGYRRLDPMPTKEELDEFYCSKYYDLVAAGGRAPELGRLIQGGEEATAELTWLSQTLWQDILDILNELCKSETEPLWLLDMGCGTGHFAHYMQKAGWKVIGVEPAKEAAEIARSLGLTVFSSVAECCSVVNQRFNVVTLLNVLEHVPDAAALLGSLLPLIEDKSIIVVRVPNDFSAIQECAHKKMGGRPWWIAIPDHVNYFNFDSLVQFLERLNFQVVDMLGDFPMEIFLLFGDVYVGNPRVGSQCHKKRIAFELSLPPELRRNLYRCLARVGMGRDCTVFAKASLSPRK